MGTWLLRLLTLMKEINSTTQVKVVADACDTYSNEGHISDEVNLKSLKELRARGAIISKTNEKSDEKNC